MNYIYKTIFNSRLKTKTPPYYYIGSKTDSSFVDGKLLENNGNFYFGSSRYKGYKDFIDNDTKVEILEEYEYIDYNKLLQAEKHYQLKVSAKTNPEYFNLSYATDTSNYSNPDYATYKHNTTGKCIRLRRDDNLVKSGIYVGITTGIKSSKEHRNKISDSIKGENNPFFNRTHSKESLDKISDKAKLRLAKSHPRQKSVIINGVKYRGVRPAARELNINPNTVINNIKKNLPGWNYESKIS